MSYKTTAVYFSATDTSRRGVIAIAETIDEKYETLDYTMIDSAKEDRYFSSEELVVIGAPVYSGRVFEGAAQRFKSLHGDGTACVVTVTYGNRHYDDALLELSDQMTEQGFRVVAAAALVGEHTYGDIQKGRPNSDDITEDKEFAEDIMKKLASGDQSIPAIPGNRPYHKGGNGGKFRPDTNEKCVHCGKCARNCPQQAIADDCKSIDNSKCIACFRCIKSCPFGAKCMTDPAYEAMTVDFSRRLAVRRENEWFI